ncbi:MAG: hypothetical protein QE487_16145 [Fluviicola sp.]|nr:hypothetical protein [Fluviicola sp.]
MSSTKEKPTGINPNSADVPAILASSISYCSLTNNVRGTLRKYLPDWTLVWEPIDAVNGNYAFIAQNGNQYMIAIRGSILNFSIGSFDNWFREDFNVFTQVQWEYPYDPVTKPMISAGSAYGLHNMSQLLGRENKGTLLNFIRQLPSTAAITVTGHSLGGGLAPVYALYLNSQLQRSGIRLQPISVVTFAGPTTGNAAFAALFNATFKGRARLYVDVIDIVPFAANNIGGIAKLFSGKHRYAPKAPIELEALFLLANDQMKKAEKEYNSYYTPLAGTILLNTAKYEFPNDHILPITAWATQAGDQHSHDNYLKLVGWLGTDFGCTGNLQFGK